MGVKWNNRSEERIKKNMKFYEENQIYNFIIIKLKIITLYEISFLPF